MMRDLRRQALESNKTVSKKAQARLQTSSRTSSAANSRGGSRTVSRQGSDNEDEDGGLSDSTAWSVNSIDEMISTDGPEDTSDAWKQDLGDRVSEIVDRKRSSVQGRETSLAQYIHILMSHYTYDEIQSRMSELFPALIKSIKAGSSERETIFALRAIALTLITVPSETAYDAIFSVLKDTYARSEYTDVKTVAIHTLSAAATYGGASESEIDEILEDFLEIVESDGASIDATDNGEVVSAACQAWGFLATFVDDMEERTEPAMDAFVDQLDSSDVSVQVAAGENIALLYEKSHTERESGDAPVSDSEEDDGAATGDKDRSMVKRYEVYRQRGQLEHKLVQLSKESSKRIAKKDRKALHTNFADILNTVEHPTRGPRYQNAIDQETGRRYGSRMKVQIHKSGSMKIDQWWKLHRLRGLRRILGGGFIVHYELNDVIFESLPAMISED